MTLRGIDVSQHQATTPNLTGLSFLFARASIGLTRDAKYLAHVAAARKAGLVVGAYHFNWREIPIADQVRLFLAAAGDVDLYAIDVEGDHAFSLAQTREFIARVHGAGKTIGLYHSDSGFPSTAGQDWNWVANWSHEPIRDWSFWQYRGSPLDLDRFAGTAIDLARLARIPTAPDTSIPEEGMKITDVEAAAGVATITAAGPVWRVADDAQVDVNAGAHWDVCGTGRYHHSAANPDGSPGYLFAANAPDGELHIVARSRVTFIPTTTLVARELAIAQGRIVKAITDLGGTP